MPDILGYNPNIDSGIAEARSYVEVSKTTLASLSSYIDLDRDPTKRYFAQIVYNVGPGSSLIDNLSADEISQVRELLGFKDSLLSIRTIILQFNVHKMVVEEENNLLTDSFNGISINNCAFDIYAKDLSGIAKGGITKITSLKEIAIPGFVCGVESYTRDSDTPTQGSEELTTSKFLPRMRTEFKDGQVITYLNLDEEIKFIIEKFNGDNDEQYRIIKISYLQQPLIELPDKFNGENNTTSGTV
jgi:hypothetical protein